ncbi:MAG: LuxR family transcriptional regulator [Gammaproteobacteria bacterium]|nr:LuxR family transcriptional regulator [Gammaproteobacteria bacterium]
MAHPNRIIIVGHPGAGKAVLARALAEKLGWKFIDADYGIEVKTGAIIQDVLGEEGVKSLRMTEHNILSQPLEHTVITTDVGIVTSKKNREMLKKDYVVFVTVSLPVQLERMLHHEVPLLINSDRNKLLTDLHDRDQWFNEVAKFTVNTDDNALHNHVEAVIKDAGLEHLIVKNLQPTIESRDMILYHYKTHQPIQITSQQALCLKLLAQGKSAKEIGQELEISYRTVEGHLAKTMEILGCSSSKELISLYLSRP